MEAFDDVGFEHPFLWEISWLAGENITTGYADGTCPPAAPVSRAAMAAYLHRFAGSPAFSAPTVATFADVPTDHPFFIEVEWLADENITTGYANGTYRPAAPVSRAAMAAYLYRFAGSPPATPEPTFADVDETHPFFAEIGWAAEEGIVQGSYVEQAGFFGLVYRPAAATSRQAMAAFLYRFADLGLAP